MKTISEINFEKSIEKKWLIYRESWFDKFDTFTHVFIVLALSFSTFTLTKSQAEFNENEIFFIYIYFFILLIVCIVVYTKLTEKRLRIIETKNNEEENKKILNKLSQRKGWLPFRNNSKAIIFVEDDVDSNKYIKVFLLKNNKIYFTVLTERFRLNYPTFTENRAVKKLIEAEIIN